MKKIDTTNRDKLLRGLRIRYPYLSHSAIARLALDRYGTEYGAFNSLRLAIGKTKLDRLTLLEKITRIAYVLTANKRAPSPLPARKKEVPELGPPFASRPRYITKGK